jgi:hypothetical protein
LLKARTVEPEKEPLLAIGCETTFVSRQRPITERRPLLGSRFLISKNRWQLLGNGLVNTFPGATDTHATEDGVFYVVRAEML